MHFQTDVTFLDQHRRHRAECQQLVDQARSNGNKRMAEMNAQTIGRLDKIIDSLERLDPEPADAR